MASKPNQFHRLTVRKAGSSEEPLNITVLESDLLWDIETAARNEGFEIVDSAVGHQLFSDVESAMRSIRAFCRR